MGTSNTEDIMKDIYKRAEQIEPTPLENASEEDVAPQIAYNKVSSQIVQQSIQVARSHENILVERPLEQAGLSGTMKKIMRKIMRFFIVPIVQDQNEFNKNIVDALEQQQNQINFLQQSLKEDYIKEVQEPYTTLNAYVHRELAKELQYTQQACRQLKQENALLRQELNELRKR